MQRRFSKFLSDLRTALPGGKTYKTVWAWLLGDSIPPPCCQKILIAHLREQGWNVGPRDFIRGAAASNHPLFVHLRLLRSSLSSESLDQLFFSQVSTTCKETPGKEPSDADQII